MRDRERFNKLAGGAAAAAAAALLLLGATACDINVKKDGEAKKNVDIQTPFGGIKVRTEIGRAHV